MISESIIVKIAIAGTLFEAMYQAATEFTGFVASICRKAAGRKG